LQETRQRVTWLEQAGGETARGCEAERLIAQHRCRPLLGVVPAASVQAIERREAAACGTVRTLARSFGMGAIDDFPDRTPQEEKATNEKLTALGEGEVNPAARRPAP
jgi:ferritin-like metal-binding protein YciE